MLMGFFLVQIKYTSLSLPISFNRIFIKKNLQANLFILITIDHEMQY